MKKPTQPAKVVPLGPALDTPDDELDMAALVTPEDIEAAKADGAARMGKRGAALLATARADGEQDDTEKPDKQR